MSARAMPQSHRSEQKGFLGFPARPPGDGEAVKGARHHWYELAGEISGTFADIDRAISGLQWSGDARTAFDAAWSQFSGHGTEASQHSHAMGDQLLKLGNQIDDAQHEWDLAMAAMAASTAIGIGLTFFTFGISDAVAEGAAAAAVGTMETVCTALDISLDAAVQALSAAIRVAAQLAVKFTWQLTIGVVSQEGANLVDGRGLGNLDLLQAAEFAGVSMIVPGVAGKVSIGGTRILDNAAGAVLSGAATDAAVQGLEGMTEGKPFSLGELLLSGALAGGGDAIGSRIAARAGAGAGDVPPEELPSGQAGDPGLSRSLSLDLPAGPARPPLSVDPAAEQRAPWVRTLSSAPRGATQEEQVRWYEENVRAPHAGDPDFERFDSTIGAWQGGSQPMLRDGIGMVLADKPTSWGWLKENATSLMDGMRAAPPEAPELYRGQWFRGSVQDALANLRVGGELKLLPSSFTHDPDFAAHYAHMDHPEPDEVSLVLRQQAGGKSLFIQPMTPDGAYSLWREGEWIGGGTYEVTGIHGVGPRSVVVDIRQVGDIDSLRPGPGGAPR